MTVFPIRRQHKYKAKPTGKCPHCGRKHPSLVEGARCAYWHQLKKLGEILHVDVHPTVTLPCGNYAADFAIWKDGEVFYEDVKGMETADWRIKRREFDRFHPAAPLRVTVGRQNKSGWVWEDSDEKKERLRQRKRQKDLL